MTRTTDDAAETTQAPSEGEPKKLLLGKRVLRHFNVKTSIQTGSPTLSSTRQRCMDETTGVIEG